jgi:hypothetical protein
VQFVGVPVLHDLEAERRLDALEPPVNRDETKALETLQRGGDRPAAVMGRLGDRPAGRWSMASLASGAASGAERSSLRQATSRRPAGRGSSPP